MFLSGEEIYDNFQQGQGGAQLSGSAALVNDLAKSYDEQADEIKKLVAITEAVWKGEASGAAQRGLGPLAVEHALAAPSLNTAQDLSNRQVGSFDEAKNRVIPVPPAPEKVAPLAAFMNPGAFVTYGQQLGAHNAAAQHNVDVMRGYEGASAYNMNMPDSYGQLTADQSEIRVAGQAQPPNGPGGGTGSTGGGGSGSGGVGGQGAGPGTVGPGGNGPGGSGPGSGGGSGPGVVPNGPGGQGTNPGGFVPLPPPGGVPGGGPGGPGGGIPVGPGVPLGGGSPQGGQGPGFGGSGLPIVGIPDGVEGGGRGPGGSGPGSGPRAGGPGIGGLRAGGPGTGEPGVGGLRGGGGSGTGGPGAGGRAGIGPVGEPVVGRGSPQSAGGRGGAASGVPFAPGAGKGRAGEDEEHERKSYLKEPDPESIFGTDEITAPPVIGGEP